jgi:hypothetical protein
MTTNHLVVKIHHGFCKAHIAKLFNNTVETCILAMQSDCSKVNQCYSKQFRDSLVTISNTPSRTRRSLHKRADANTWKLAFWISMIVVGVPAFFSVIGIPFYLLILFVASNTIDFDQLASRDW